MKTIETSLIEKSVKELCIEAATIRDDKLLCCLKNAKEKEHNLAKSILEQIIENDTLAKNEGIPMCQDTGIAVVFVEIVFQFSIVVFIESGASGSKDMLVVQRVDTH